MYGELKFEVGKFWKWLCLRERKGEISLDEREQKGREDEEYKANYN